MNYLGVFSDYQVLLIVIAFCYDISLIKFLSRLAAALAPRQLSPRITE